MLSDIIKTKLATWLDTHKPACPICGKKEWKLPPEFFRVPTGADTVVVAVLMIAFNCDSCGYVFLVEPGAMGVKGLSPQPQPPLPQPPTPPTT